MENKSNRSNDRLKKEIDKNIVVKNLINYYPKNFWTYIGSKNHTLFFCQRDSFLGLKRIVIKQQFSLNYQSKVIKIWTVDFRKIALMNKSHEIIAFCDNQIEKWEFDSCYNLTKSSALHFHDKSLNDSDESQDLLYENSLQLQLGTKDDWIVASQKRKILFLQKGMKGEWKLIHTMKIHFQKFILNEIGNILLLLKKSSYTDEFYLTIYIKNNYGEWNHQQMETFEDDIFFCFLDNEQFVVLSNNIITIYQVKPKTFEVSQLQQLKLGLKNSMQLYGIIYMKQNQLLIVYNFFAIYFIKKKNYQFYFTQCIEIQKKLQVIGSEGLLLNIVGCYHIPLKIEILKIHVN